MSVSTIDTEMMKKGAFILKSISHPVRLGLILLLDKNAEMSVGELTQLTGEEQSAISHHLINMKLKGILTSRREGNRILYSLKEKEVVRVLDCIQNCNCNLV